MCLYLYIDIYWIYNSNNLYYDILWNDSYTLTIQHQDKHQVGAPTVVRQRAFNKKITDYFSNNCEIQKSASINIIVTILFFLICWTPFQYSLGQEHKFRQTGIVSKKLLLFISLIKVTRKNADWKNGIPIVTLVYVNSALNPFLYSLLTNNFRQEFSIFVIFLETMDFFRSQMICICFATIMCSNKSLA